MNPLSSPLLTDLYQLNMMQAYLDHDEIKAAVFEFFVRKLPPRRGFLIAAGLEQTLQFLENLRFSREEIEWLAGTRRFDKSLLDQLTDFRFTGDVHALPEGRVFFANEPVLRITAPMPQAQLVETRVINLLHFQTLIASKAARMVLAAPGKLLVDFGLRRAHGAEAGLMAARASYIAGFAGTATMLAEHEFGIPTFGTMAHSFVEAYETETSAFESFAQSRPGNLTLLIDTYDTEAAARKVVALAPRLASKGIKIAAVRLDSGDLISLARNVRRVLDDGGLSHVSVFASGGLDENNVAEIIRAGAPIDGFGIGTSLTTSSDAPALDCAYKLQEYAGAPRRKRSSGKATWPGRKQIWRQYGPDGRLGGDTLSIETASHPGEQLIEQVMKGGRRLLPAPTLDAIRTRARQDLQRLPDSLRELEPAATYPVKVADELIKLAEDVDRRLEQNERAAV
ncbi:MAG TPA: nicotinate phosphoribosyltransferase [Pseudolabrys sp.]